VGKFILIFSLFLFIYFINFSFVNYADIDSCNQAVEHMNNFVVKGFTLRVSHSGVN
jgi:RNA recognition motif-containing protein